MGEKRVFEQIDLESDPPQWRMVSGRNEEVCPWSDLIYYNPASSGTSARDSSASTPGPVAMGSRHETGEMTSDALPAAEATPAGEAERVEDEDVPSEVAATSLPGSPTSYHQDAMDPKMAQRRHLEMTAVVGDIRSQGRASVQVRISWRKALLHFDVLHLFRLMNRLH